MMVIVSCANGRTTRYTFLFVSMPDQVFSLYVCMLKSEREASGTRVQSSCLSYDWLHTSIVAEVWCQTKLYHA